MQSVFGALLLIKIEWCRYYGYSHFTEEKAETQEVGQLAQGHQVEDKVSNT